MKKTIQFLVLLFLGLTAMAQETPPAGLKSVSAQFYINPADSSIWQNKGAPYGWQRVGRYKDLSDYLKLTGGNMTGSLVTQGGLLVNGTSGQGLTVQNGSNTTPRTFISKDGYKVITATGFTDLEKNRINFSDGNGFTQYLQGSTALTSNSVINLPTSSGTLALVGGTANRDSILGRARNGLTYTPADSTLRLGGSLNTFTQITLNTNPLLLSGADPAGNFILFDTQNTGNNTEAKVNLSSQGSTNGVRIQQSTSGKFNIIDVYNNGIRIQDQINSKGAFYDGNYRGNFDQYSLIDKGYADSLASISGVPVSKHTNGLTSISPDSIGLGGNLTHNTYIGGNYELQHGHKSVFLNDVRFFQGSLSSNVLGEFYDGLKIQGVGSASDDDDYMLLFNSNGLVKSLYGRASYKDSESRFTFTSRLSATNDPVDIFDVLRLKDTSIINHRADSSYIKNQYSSAQGASAWIAGQLRASYTQSDNVNFTGDPTSGNFTVIDPVSIIIAKNGSPIFQANQNIVYIGNGLSGAYPGSITLNPNLIDSVAKITSTKYLNLEAPKVFINTPPSQDNMPFRWQDTALIASKIAGNYIQNQTSLNQAASFRIDGVGIYGDPSGSHTIITPNSVISVAGTYSGTLDPGRLSFSDGTSSWDIAHSTGNNATIRGNTTFDNGTVKSNITPTTGTEVLRLKDTTLIAANLNTSLIRNGSSLQASASFNISEIGQTQTAFVAGDYLTPGTAFSSHSPNGYSVVNTSGIVSLLKAGEISMLNNVGDTNPWKITKLSYGAKIQTTTEFIDTLKSDIDPINPTDVVNFRALGSAISGISGDYIQNQISVFQSANMLINGIGGFKGGIISGNPLGLTYGAIQRSPDSLSIKFQLNAPSNLLAIATNSDSTVIGSTKPIAITSGAHLSLNFVPSNSYDATNKYYVDNAVAGAGSGVYELLSNKINTIPDNSNTHYPTTHSLKIATDNLYAKVDTFYIPKSFPSYGLIENSTSLKVDTTTIVSKINLASQMALKLSKTDTTTMLGNIVHKALNETITGTKTYSSNILFSSTNSYNIGSSSVAAANVFSRTLVSDLALQFNTLNNNSIQFSVNSSERARFAATTGNFLIAATADDGTGSKLQVFGASSNTINSLGAVTGDAYIAQNTTAAANNAQQYSPAIHFKGNGWGTTAGTSQSTDWKIYNQPIQGTVPSSNLSFDFSGSGGSYQAKLTLSSGGNLNTLGTYSAFRGASTDAFAATNTAAATSGTTVQQSPRFHLSGASWNTSGTPASNTQDAINELRPTSGATTGSQLYWAFQNNGGGYVDAMSIDNNGVLRMADGIANFTTANNSRVQVTATGTVISNNTATSNNTLTVNNINASNTGSIAKFQFGGSDKFTVDNTGKGIFSSNVTATQFKLSALNTAPTSSTDTGTTGEIRFTSGYIYLCTGTNTWVRSALTTF